jgi:hypothetical protein
VDVFAVVFVGQVFWREFSKSVMEVAGDQQRRRVEGVPTWCPVVRHDIDDYFGAALPKAHEVLGLGREAGEFVQRSLGRIAFHDGKVSTVSDT